MRDAAFQAMQFAHKAHAGQRRKYTGNPYTDHLAEVVGICMSVGWHDATVHPDTMMATAWLHDTIEGCNVSRFQIKDAFGPQIMEGVLLLSDLETGGNRAQRKAASRERLAGAPCWVQTIKVADIISNTSSIVEHDPKFAVVYLEEKRLLLDVLTKADKRLVAMARSQTGVA